VRAIEHRVAKLEGVEARRRPEPAPYIDPADMRAFTILMSTHPDHWPPGLFAATEEILASLPGAWWSGR
jgi:hypothetical protein